MLQLCGFCAKLLCILAPPFPLGSSHSALFERLPPGLESSTSPPNKIKYNSHLLKLAILISISKVPFQLLLICKYNLKIMNIAQVLFLCFTVWLNFSKMKLAPLSPVTTMLLEK